MSEESVSELESNSVEIIPIKNKEKKDGKQKYTAPLTHGTVSKGLTFMSLESLKKRREGLVQKIFEEIIAENFQIWGKT